MGGYSINSGAPWPAEAYFFTNRGATAAYQLQAIDGSYTKCVKVELSQIGVDILARAIYAKYASGNQLGFDFDTSTSNALLVATSYSAKDYGVAETTLSFNSPSRLTLSGISSYAGGTVVNNGALEATSANSALPSYGGIAVNSGGELVLNVAGLAAAPGGVGDINSITVNSGGTLTLAGQNNVGYARPVTINGGTLNSIVTTTGDSVNFFSNLTLKNNARVVGDKIRMSDIGSSVPSIIVSGTSASSIEAGMILLKYSSQSMTFNIKDVTGDPEPDLLIPGVIQDYDLPGRMGLPIIKSGAGTLSISGVNTHTGRITIAEGTLALRADNTLNTSCRIVLSGGTLDMGSFFNAVETLALTGNSQLTLGDGQLAFADSSGETWEVGKTLTLTGTLGPQSLRFGTNDSALTSAQLSAINLNGERVRIKSNGYLASGLKGTLILVQ